MITEIAQIDVKPGTEKDFEAAVAKARPLFLRAKGGKGLSCTSRSRSRRVTG
jgi:heme-degrading monooxygenase HmoA